MESLCSQRLHGDIRGTASRGDLAQTTARRVEPTVGGPNETAQTAADTTVGQLCRIFR